MKASLKMTAAFHAGYRDGTASAAVLALLSKPGQNETSINALRDGIVPGIIASRLKYPETDAGYVKALDVLGKANPNALTKPDRRDATEEAAVKDARMRFTQLLAKAGINAKGEARAPIVKKPKVATLPPTDVNEKNAPQGVAPRLVKDFNGALTFMVDVRDLLSTFELKCTQKKIALGDLGTIARDFIASVTRAAAEQATKASEEKAPHKETVAA